MGFSPQIRDAALVASARHCCVCRRYAGVKIEVHHIIAQASGGDDSFDNAIPLCFDCHADAGHYNSKHPRGTRFSPTELRRHRDEWYNIVKGGGVASASDPGLIYARHVVCRDISAIEEMCTGNLAPLPITRPRLWQNPVLEFVRKFQSGRAVRKLIGEYKSLDDVKRAYPEVPGLEKLHQVGEVRVGLTAERAKDELKDQLTCALLDEGVPVEDLVYSYIYHNKCGTEAYYQFADTRPVWLSSLTIENATETVIVVDDLDTHVDVGDGMGYRQFASAGARKVLALPPVPLEPGSNVVIPEAVILAPFGGVAFVSYSEIDEDQQDSIQVLGHGELRYNDPTLLRLIGPALHIERTMVSSEGRRVACDIHPLDPSNVYVLDRHWMVGCCPHLFYHTCDDNWSHEGNILVSSAPGTLVTVRRRLPRGCDTIRIWELEHETTHLASLRLDNTEQLTEPLCLARGQWIDVTCTGVQELEVSGWYDSDIPASSQHSLYLRVISQDALATLSTMT
jgi:hypothetical protein